MSGCLKWCSFHFLLIKEDGVGLKFQIKIGYLFFSHLLTVYEISKLLKLGILFIVSLFFFLLLFSYLNVKIFTV